jgi:hypothetical protein
MTMTPEQRNTTYCSPYIHQKWPALCTVGRHEQNQRREGRELVYLVNGLECLVNQRRFQHQTCYLQQLTGYKNQRFDSAIL